ncbi:hypothetical protein F183_A52700 [Bryobacterales bacterium F-183]|nr:hypothetical protein F183_A52700 [Bryobacterales bacterium F-183]
MYFPSGNVIYRLDHPGNLTRFAGTGAGGSSNAGLPARDTFLTNPQNPTFDTAGNLYFYDDFRIRMVERSTGLIRDVYVPPSSNTFILTPAFALDPDGTILIVARIRETFQATQVLRYNPATQTTVRVAGTSNAPPFPPTDLATDLELGASSITIAVDAAGDIWIAPRLTKIIKSTGRYQRMDVSAISTADILQILPNGDLLLAGSRLFRFTPSTGTAIELAGGGSLIEEGRLASEAGGFFRGALYRNGTSQLVVASDAQPTPLWTIDSATNRFRFLAGKNVRLPELGGLPGDAQLYPSGSIFSLAEGGIGLSVGQPVFRLRDGQPVSKLFDFEYEVRSIINPAPGEFYILGREGFIDGLYRFDGTAPTPQRAALQALGSGSRFGRIAFDPGSRSIIGTQTTIVNRLVAGLWKRIGEIVSPGGATSIRISPTGELYHCNPGWGDVLSGFNIATLAQFNLVIPGGCWDIDLDAEGNIYYLTFDRRFIRRIDAHTRTITEIAGGDTVTETGPSVGAILRSPYSIAVDRATQDLYVSENRIRQITGLASYRPNPNVAFAVTAPFRVPAASTSITLPIQTAPGVSWTTASTVPWISITSATSGTGNGQITIQVQPSSLSTSRTGSLTLNGNTFPIEQQRAECVYTLDRYSVTDTDQIQVLTNVTGCPFSAVNNTSWISLQASAISPNAIMILVAKNFTGVTRTGIVNIAGHTVTVTQQGVFDSAKLTFRPLAPCRILDTRLTGSPLRAGDYRALSLQNECGLPANALAVSLNVTVVPKGPLGYLSLWGASGGPSTSLLNSLDGRIKANAVIVPTGETQRVTAFANGETDLIIDINGYFVNGTEILFYPLAPCRIADTRLANGTFGGPILPAASTRTFPIPQSACPGIPSNAVAYSLNATVVPPAALGYLTLYPTGSPRPTVSTLNALTGTVVANAAIVPAGTNGAVDAFVSGTTHLVLDINGYFAPASNGPGGLAFIAGNNCRALDTRLTLPMPLSAGSTTPISLNDFECGVPSGAKAVALNATVLPADPQLGYLSLWPSGTPQPVVSTLNALDGALTSNAAILPVNNQGIQAFVSGRGHLLFDISGYFVP